MSTKGSCVESLVPNTMSNRRSVGKGLDHKNSDVINDRVMFDGLLGGVETERRDPTGGSGPLGPGKIHLVLGFFLSQSLLPGSHRMNALYP